LNQRINPAEIIFWQSHICLHRKFENCDFFGLAPRIFLCIITISQNPKSTQDMHNLLDSMQNGENKNILENLYTRMMLRWSPRSRKLAIYFFLQMSPTFQQMSPIYFRRWALYFCEWALSRYARKWACCFCKWALYTQFEMPTCSLPFPQIGPPFLQMSPVFLYMSCMFPNLQMSPVNTHDTLSRAPELPFWCREWCKGTCVAVWGGTLWYFCRSLSNDVAIKVLVSLDEQWCRS